MFIKISKALDKYCFEIGDNNTDVPSSFLSSIEDHCLIPSISEKFQTFVEAHHYASEIVDTNPTIVLAKKLFFYKKSMEESGIDETHSAVNDKILECYGDQLSLIEKRFKEFEDDMESGEYKPEENKKILQSLKEEISKITGGIEKIADESDFSDDETEQLNNVYFGLTKITEKIDKIFPPEKTIGAELPQAPTEPSPAMPAEMPQGTPGGAIGASNNIKMVKDASKILEPMSLGLLKDRLDRLQKNRDTIEKEIYGEINEEQNLKLKSGFSIGTNGKITGSGIRDESDYVKKLEYANEQWKNRQNEINELDDEIRRTKKQIDKTIKQENQTIIAKNAGQILKAFGESAVLAINKLHPLSYIKNIYKDNETEDYSIVIAERDKNIIGLKFSNNLLLNEIVPLQNEHYRNIYASDFLEKYWIPITYSVGHIVMGSSVIVPNYNMSHKKIYGFNQNGKTVVATISIENADKSLGIKKSWQIKLAQENKKRISDFTQEKLVNAEVVCIDKKLPTYYQHSGRVLSVIPRDDYIDLTVDFRSGLDKLVLRDDQVDIVKLPN